MNDKQLHSSANLWIYLTVFITGASVMVIELLGTRMIAPFYGASLYVWSSLISVTMIALAIGYFTGGRWADRAQRTGLSLIIALAALFTLLIPWATRPVLLVTDSLGLRGGAFTSALVLFMPSLTLLSMVGPFAIKLATAKLEGVGASSGSIYAVSTLGSVIGTLLLGFFLFPWVGSRQILISTALVLFVLALLVAIIEQKRSALKITVLPCVALMITGLCLLPLCINAGQAPSDNRFQVLSERESLYGYVRVIDQESKNLRFLTSDASMIGAANITDGANRLTYQDIVALIPAIKPSIKKTLLIGQGAGHMAMALQQKYSIVVDTLEIDPAVAEAASTYFGFKPNGKAVIGDARYEIRHLTGPYDLIIHDCFTGGSEPSHLLTVETLQQLKGLLSPDGMLALNFVGFGEGEGQRGLASVSHTLKQVFAEQSLYISEPGEAFNDFIFLAGNQPLDFAVSTLSAEQTAWLNQRRYAINATDGLVLTDNLNPLEHLQIRKSERYREVLLSWFGGDLLIR
ncbi:MAG: SAM-dependent methyltransferase [Gammaproteobacteria bacterium]|nr:SAM-dependent methyltransferase [Gammaproteobacteria bacterium]